MLFLQSSSVFETHGGIEYYLDDLLQLACEYWGADGQQTLVPQRRELKALDRPYRVTPVAMQMQGWLSKIENRYSPIYFRTALSRIRAERPDYLVCGHVSLGPLAAALSWVTGVPYISCVYGIEAWGDLVPQDEWVLQNASGILSISEWTKERLVRRGLSASRIQVIHPRLDTRFENLPLVDEKPAQAPLRLLTVSRLDASEQYKGQDHVLRALSLLRQAAPQTDFRYTIQGEGDDRPRLQELALALNLEDRVLFAGSCADRLELQTLYRTHDLFVMPSRFGRWGGRWRGEGFGIVYLEAAAMGIPSLAYDCGGVTDIVEDGKTGRLVAPDDIAGIAKALLEFSMNRGTLKTLGCNAHAMVNRRFNRSAIWEEMELAFKRIRESRPEKATKSQSPQPDELPGALP